MLTSSGLCVRSWLASATGPGPGVTALGTWRRLWCVDHTHLSTGIAGSVDQLVICTGLLPIAALSRMCKLQDHQSRPSSAATTVARCLCNGSDMWYQRRLGGRRCGAGCGCEEAKMAQGRLEATPAVAAQARRSDIGYGRHRVASALGFALSSVFCSFIRL